MTKRIAGYAAQFEAGGVRGSGLVNNTIGQGGFWGGIGSLWITTSDIILTNPGNLTVANVVRVLQFELLKTQTVGHILFHITTGTTLGVVDVGIYDVNGNLLINTGGVPAIAASSVNVAPAQGSVVLTPGIYYFAFTGSTTGGIISNIAWDALQVSGFLTNSGEVNTNGKRWGTAANSGVSGVLPASLGVITSNTQTLFPPVTFFEA